MPRKKTTKKSVVPTPQDLNEAADFVRQIGEAERAIEKLKEDTDITILVKTR